MFKAYKKSYKKHGGIEFGSIWGVTFIIIMTCISIIILWVTNEFPFM